MRIAFFAGKFYSDMKEASLLTMLNLAKVFQAKGHKVVIFGSGGDGLNKYEVIEGIEVFRGPYLKSKYIVPVYHPAFIFNNFFSPMMAYFRCKYKFDIIHSFSSSPLLSYRTIIPKFFNRKLIALHSIKSFSMYSGKKSLNFRYMNKLDAIVTNLVVIKKYLISGGVHQNKIHIIRSNIDENKFFRYDDNKKNVLKKKYGFADSKIALYYGPLVERKGINYLIEAFSDVIKDVKKCKLVLAYKDAVIIDKHISDVKKLALSFDVNLKDIIFVKPWIKIEDYVNIADVVVMPYPELIGTEGNPSCILESLACGTPVVTSDLPELREFLSDDVVYFAKAKDSKSISEQIKLSFVDKNRTRKIMNGLKLVKEFGTKKIAEEHLKLYEQLFVK